jgi:alpha-mannosidase
VGKDEMDGSPGERHKTLCKDVHPRGIQNWIYAGNDKTGITLSSDVAVADWIDPTTNPVKKIILQPLLMASRRSCHSEGNEYLQTGDHHFSFSLISNKPGWQNGFKAALETNEKMQVVVDPEMYKNASLPLEMSFFSSENDNLIISTVKRAEDNNGFVVRAWDIRGTDCNTRLNFFTTIKQGLQTDLLEYPLHKIKTNSHSAEINVGHHGIETFLFQK